MSKSILTIKRLRSYEIFNVSYINFTQIRRSDITITWTTSVFIEVGTETDLSVKSLSSVKVLPFLKLTIQFFTEYEVDLLTTQPLQLQVDTFGSCNVSLKFFSSNFIAHIWLDFLMWNFTVTPILISYSSLIWHFNICIVHGWPGINSSSYTNEKVKFALVKNCSKNPRSNCWKNLTRSVGWKSTLEVHSCSVGVI